MSLHSWLRNLRSALAPGRGQRHDKRRGSPRTVAHRLYLEALEDRSVPTFLPPVDYTVGAGPFVVKAGDFNDDGIPDLVTANQYSATVSVLLSNGDGTFQPARDTPTGRYPVSMAVGDFNQDGTLDLATGGGQYADSLTILLGRGDGTFVQAPTPFGPDQTSSLVAGDLNGDGTLDLVTTSVDYAYYSEDQDITIVSVMLGRGDGTFAFDRWYGPFEGAVYAQKLADFDGDGNADVFADGFNRLTAPNWLAMIFRGNGDGTLQEPSAFDPGDALWTMADFNADGNLDHAYLGQAALSVSLGNGDGGFGPPFTTALGFQPVSLAVADFNGDGRPDAAVTNLDPHQVTVLFNDGVWDGPPPPPPAPSVTINDRTVTEGNTGTTPATFTVTLSAAYDQTVTVAYVTADGTAMAGSDYVATSGTLTFAPGEVSKSVTVLVNGDRLGESNETFFVNLSSPTNATIADGQGAAVIVDNDPHISINPSVSHSEGNTGQTPFTFTVTVSPAYDLPVTVDWATADNSATAGSDYQAASGTLTFAPGEVSKTIAVLVNGDRLGELNETFFVNLSNPNYGVIFDAQGVGVIVDDEPQISISDVTRKEGNGKKSTLFTFTVTLSAPYDEPVTMSYTTVNGSATTGDGDYVAKTGTLTFAPGETTKTITIEVKGDRNRESSEVFYLDLFNLSSNALFTKNRGLGTILNDD